MNSLTGTHINHFHIIVCMPGKMDKTSVWANLNQLSLLEHFPAVNDKGGGIGVDGGINGWISV